jgi:ABC-2 type transport system ATP-binding protein
MPYFTKQYKHSSVILHCHEVSHSYGKVVALRDVSVTQTGAGCVALIGANGAGKSTLLRGIVGAHRFSRGRVSLSGNELYPESPARADLGYLSENGTLPIELSVEEVLWGATLLHGLSKSQSREACDWVIMRCHLNELRSRRCGTLSRGQRQRVRLASSLVHRPQLLVLDEVHSGLDPLQTAELNDLLKDLSQSCLVLLSTHRLSAAEQITDTYWVLHGGQLLADGPIDSWGVKIEEGDRGAGRLERAYRSLIKTYT